MVDAATCTCIPDEERKAEFLKRKPALGLSLQELELLRQHVTSLLPVQLRLLFKMFQNSLVCNLICCDGASSIEELFLILEAEIKSGQPSPTLTGTSLSVLANEVLDITCALQEIALQQKVLTKDLALVVVVGLHIIVEWNVKQKIGRSVTSLCGKEGEAEYFLKLMQDSNIRAMVERIHGEKRLI